MNLSYEIDLRVLFKKFYCPRCGEKLVLKKVSTKLTEEQKKQYYKNTFFRTTVVPMNIDVSKVKQMFFCPKCSYYNTTSNQLIIRKEQKRLKKKILGE